MPYQGCPCCQWNVLVPDHAEVIYSCPECGQCLAVPQPWSPANISNCDTRPLLAPGEGPAASPGSGLIPEVLSYRRPPRLHNFRRNILLSIAGLILGVFCTIMTLFSDGLAQSPLQRLVYLVIDLFIMFCAAFMLMNSLRRRRRQATARAFSLPDPVPMELARLGTPIAVHHVKRSSLWLGIVLGMFMLMAGVGVLVLVWRGEIQDGRWYIVAIFGPIVGLSSIVKSCRSSGLRILVLTKGLISWQGERAEVWPWDQIVAIWLKYEFLAKDESTGTNLEGYTYTLVRQDGERLNYHINLEFFENQLGTRAQYELCVRLLPKLQADLQNRSVVEFGPLQLSEQGISCGMDVLAWEDLEEINIDKGTMVIRRKDRRKAMSVPIQSVPNLAAFLLLTDRADLPAD
jgi:hypothetical protein